jgi:integrase
LLREIHRKPQDVASADIRSYLSGLRASKKPKTYNDILCAIKRFFRDYLGSDVADSSEFVPVPQRPIVLPSQRELKRFYKSLPSQGHFQGERIHPVCKALFLFLASSGLRVGETLSLRKKDFSLKDRKVIPQYHKALGNRRKEEEELLPHVCWGKGRGGEVGGYSGHHLGLL